MRHGASCLLAIAMLGASMSGAAADAPDRPWDCSAGRSTPSTAPARLKPAEVIELATAAAKRRGYDLANLRQMGLCFDASPKRAAWTVHFDVRNGVPVQHFRIRVRDDTGKATLMPGQ